MTDYTDLPFRFSLTPTMSSRWALLTSDIQLKLWLRFVGQAEELTNARLDSKATVDVYLPGKFAEASLLANSLQVSTHHLSVMLGRFMTAILRAGAKSRGEVEITATWASLQGRRYALEVPCLVGRIDVVFEDDLLVVEAKYASEYKHAIGQSLSYRECYRMAKGSHWQAGLLLLGQRTRHDYRTIESICKSLDIVVFWHHDT